MSEHINDFATELLHEVKTQTKRWFTAFTIMCFLEVMTIFGFVWYISLPIDDISVDSNGSGTATYIGNDLNGELINGESENSTKSNQK